MTEMIRFAKPALLKVSDALRKEIGWVIVNLAAMLVPVLFEVWLIAPRSQWDSLNGIDVLVMWVFTVFPLLAVIFIVNIIWLIQVWRRNHGRPRQRAFGTWLLVCCLWLVPLCLNPDAFRVLWLIKRMIDGPTWAH
jgi:hypothetical protein